MRHEISPTTSNASSVEEPSTGGEERAPRRSRSEASRINGAKSRGPKTREGKGRSSRHALKHGVRAAQTVVLSDEDMAEFDSFATRLMHELAPIGAQEENLATRVVNAAWRARRSDRIEAGVFGFCFEEGPMSYEDCASPVTIDGKLGTALIRDTACGPKALETMLLYRGSVQNDYYRALTALKALQAEREQRSLDQKVVPQGDRRLEDPSRSE